MVVYVTLLWSTREAEVLLALAGQLACEAANFALKRLIKEERPQRSGGGGSSTVAKGYGMPSSHAQFAVFWAVALALFLLARHRPTGPAYTTTADRAPPTTTTNTSATTTTTTTTARTNNPPGTTKAEPEPAPAAGLAGVRRAYRNGGWPAAAAAAEAYAHGPWAAAERAAASAGALCLAALVAWSRVYLGYHTVRQVLAGCAAGLVCAVGWFAATGLLRGSGLLARALDTPVARWFRLRDLVVDEDPCQAGWEKWERRRRELRLREGLEKKAA